MISIYEIIKDNNPAIRKISKTVKIPLVQADIDSINDIVNYCLNSQFQAAAGAYHDFIAAIGIAAIQINKPLRAFFIYYPEGDCNILMVNPKVQWKSDTMCYIDQEGCLSVPQEKTGVVMRHHEIKFSYYDFFSRKAKHIHLKGMSAIIAQHEFDHLEGILYKDKVINKSQVSKKAILIKR